jgi:dTDP-D-glucose 4,6-dehydratase
VKLVKRDWFYVRSLSAIDLIIHNGRVGEILVDIMNGQIDVVKTIVMNQIRRSY